MGSYPLWKRVLNRLAYAPVWFAYRIIWLTAKLGSRNAQDVLKAMWGAGLNVPGFSEQVQS